MVGFDGVMAAPPDSPRPLSPPAEQPDVLAGKQQGTCRARAQIPGPRRYPCIFVRSPSTTTTTACSRVSGGATERRPRACLSRWWADRNVIEPRLGGRFVPEAIVDGCADNEEPTSRCRANGVDSHRRGRRLEGMDATMQMTRQPDDATDRVSTAPLDAAGEPRVAMVG